MHNTRHKRVTIGRSRHSQLKSPSHAKALTLRETRRPHGLNYKNYDYEVEICNRGYNGECKHDDWYLPKPWQSIQEPNELYTES
jgi:hypothetical protein